MNETRSEKFFSSRVSIDPETRCWEWQGAIAVTGYGVCKRRGRTRFAHRAAYMELVGPIPEGLTIDHLCRNHRCVNPVHLEAVTITENILRGTSPAAQNARKTHCLRGHPFNEANTYMTPRGGRVCRACYRTHSRNWYARNGDHCRAHTRWYSKTEGGRQAIRRYLDKQKMERHAQGRVPAGQRTHCNHGHKFTATNTGQRQDGWRYCRTCRQLQTAARSWRRRAQRAQQQKQRQTSH